MNEIVIQGLTKKYGDILAVNDLNLQIGAGELFALLGVNGAGKSTTIRMLSGLTAPTAGDATLCGFSLSRERQKVKSVLAVSPQETAVAPNLTVRENLRLMAGLHGVTEDGEALLRRFQLEEVAARRAKTLSGGWAAPAQHRHGAGVQAPDSVSGRADAGAGCAGPAGAVGRNS